MKPTKQTIYTCDDGNCLAASLASILENNIDDYPQLPNDKSWYPLINDYLNKLGYTLLLIEGVSEFALKGFHLIIGYNESSGMKHCVVGKDGKVVFDPSPFRDQNSKPLTEIYYGFITKIIE